ncbi:MAG: hypothetical protein ACEPOZ_06670 [Marinifilaceae bacterium]
MRKNQSVTDFFQAVRQEPNKYHRLPKLEGEPNKIEIIQQLKTYQLDSISGIRKYSYQLAHQIGQLQHDTLLKQTIVNFLLQGFHDKDTGICGIVSDLLKEYPPAFYSNNARSQILELLPMAPPYYSELIKLAGYIHPQSAPLLLEELLASRVIKRNTDRWAAHLALARMNDKTSISYCVQQIKKQEVDDDLVYDVLPDLIYTHQRESIDYLIELLNSDEKNCETADPESDVKITCAYRVMEYLVPVIRNFPLHLNASGDVNTEDYREALLIAREWFLQNPNYQIIRDQY